MYECFVLVAEALTTEVICKAVRGAETLLQLTSVGFVA